jgi:hypothetical protein
MILKRYKNHILIGLFGIILFFVNVKDSHDWGGDFAMYISQARNIAEGLPQSDTHYLFNDDYPVLGPPAYPVGFPLLLAPVYALMGNSVLAFTLFITLVLFLYGLLMVDFFSLHFKSYIPFFLGMLVLFNPWTLMFKMEVMSDIPFAFFLLLGVCLFTRAKTRNYLFLILMSLLAGFLVSIRTIGLVFPLAILVYAVIQGVRSGKKWYFLEGGIIFVAAVMVSFLLNRVIFPIPAADGLSYLQLFGSEPLWKTLSGNLIHYVDALQYYFTPYTHHWKWAAVIMHSVALAFIVLGFINRLARKLDLTEILVILYLGVILVYPYRHAGFRFLLPVMPFLLHYMVAGMQSFNLAFRVHTDLKVTVIGVMALLLYMNSFLHMINQRHVANDGPQQASSLEAFEFIRNNTSGDARVAFFKPRVLGLYTSRLSLAVRPGAGADLIGYQLEKASADYVLVHIDHSHQSLKDYINGNPGSFSLIWQNEKFRFYEKKP